jgi:hypothetical protein
MRLGSGEGSGDGGVVQQRRCLVHVLGVVVSLHIAILYVWHLAAMTVKQGLTSGRTPRQPELRCRTQILRLESPLR